MLTLGIEASGRSAGAALLRDGRLLSEYSLNVGLTHSETLLPLIEALLKASGVSLSDLDLIAVSAGPGSFTGLRIGASTAKGLALPGGIPLLPVSTLEGLMQNVSEFPGYVHPILDARRSQVYTASYLHGEKVLPEEAVSMESLMEKIRSFPGKQLFLGDGVFPYRELLSECLGEKLVLASPANLLQRASSIAILGERNFSLAKSAEKFRLHYVRKPQAEREREAKGLRDYDLLGEKRGEETKDRLLPRNYPIDSGGYEN